MNLPTIVNTLSALVFVSAHPDETFCKQDVTLASGEEGGGATSHQSIINISR